MSETPDPPEPWRRCSACKNPIGFQTRYWACSVSTCNRRGTDFAFCSVPCWDSHVPIMNHRDAWAEEKASPSREEWLREGGHASASDRPSTTARSSRPAGEKEAPMENSADDSDEILVVASKLKHYIREKSGMNTAASVLEALSDRIRAMCDGAIEAARQDGRKTVMGRDFE